LTFAEVDVPSDELSFVDWLRRYNPPCPAIELPIGDDMGVVRSGAGRVLLSSDLLLDGVHVDSRVHSYEGIGRKALARSLSDCAAMAVRPIVTTVSVVFPRSVSRGNMEALFQGIWKLACTFEVGIIGGDTAKWDHPLCLDVTVQAEPYDGIEPVTRAGARPGDRLYVTGTLGGSILGKHLDFTPRIAEAEAIARTLGPALHAMIDISDGLSLDLWRLCNASKLGAVLSESELRHIASEAALRDTGGDHFQAISHVLSDGEDYELLMAIGPEAGVAGLPIFPIGCTVAGQPELRLRNENGEHRPLTPSGFTHS
jgi:thiamine-monophosphate kinase